MKTLFVICARKGSKRLKNKHHLEVGDRPLWAFAADAATYASTSLCRGYRVFSTDDPEILDELNQHPHWGWGLGRPRRLSDDKTPIHEVLQHAMGVFGSRAQKMFKAVAFLPANVPTVTPELIASCVNKLARDKRLTSVVTVRTVRDNPEWMFWAKSGVLKRLFVPEGAVYRCQDLPARYVPTGTVNVVRSEVLMACKSAKAFAYLGDRIGYVLDEDAIEVHDKRDLEMARAWMAWRSK